MKYLITIAFILNLYGNDNMKIHIKSDNNTIVFKLNNSMASQNLYKQLPLRIKIENYSTNEKIFYPPKKLSIDNTPKANAKNGTLAYYAPWGNVVIFYKDFGSANGLYELGFVEKGESYIPNIKGYVDIEKE